MLTHLLSLPVFPFTSACPERRLPLTDFCSFNIELETQSWETGVSWSHHRLVSSVYGASLDRSTLMVNGTDRGRTEAERVTQIELKEAVKLASGWWADVIFKMDLLNCQFGLLPVPFLATHNYVSFQTQSVFSGVGFMHCNHRVCASQSAFIFKPLSVCVYIL